MQADAIYYDIETGSYWGWRDGAWMPDRISRSVVKRDDVVHEFVTASPVKVSNPIAEAVAAEREACAEMAETLPARTVGGSVAAGIVLAARIRARGNPV